MGLTGRSVGKNAARSEMKKAGKEIEMTVALAGNPNVGKSTIFNILTGLHQHTGNWTGKTVTSAVGYHKEKGKLYRLCDLPGGYSLAARSKEEAVARDYLCFGDADAVIVVCDATRLARNLGLVYQILEITPNVLVCLNLMDEARREGIRLSPETLSERLGVPVVPTSAGSGEGVSSIMKKLPEIAAVTPVGVTYPKEIEDAVAFLMPHLQNTLGDAFPLRFAALRLIEGDTIWVHKLCEHLQKDIVGEWQDAIAQMRERLDEQGFSEERCAGVIADTVMATAAKTASSVTEAPPPKRELCRADKLLTSRLFGIPAMLLLAALIFWITIVGANAPSELLSRGFRALEEPFHRLLLLVGLGNFLSDMLTYGLYRVLSWIVAVMLPPMAIFFPLFTFLEDVGYLPRVAYNLDGLFSRHHICGKQALTMCMGLGCNAAGVVGARIMDTERERKIAILTNGFMPCNGRFPALITVASVFFVGAVRLSSLLAAAVLAAVIVFSVMATLIVSDALSRLLPGKEPSFLLELPPYRRPQIGKILVRSVLDRTIFVLGRAVLVAAPAGILIFLLSNLFVGGASLAAWISEFLDPFGRFMGLDGIVLFAFILGFPANEIVLPLAVMLYLGSGTLSEIGDLAALRIALVSAGWTWSTAVSFILFSVMHFPCSTTLITIKKETGSMKMAVFAFLIPTVLGIVICSLFHGIVCLFS